MPNLICRPESSAAVTLKAQGRPKENNVRENDLTLGVAWIPNSQKKQDVVLILKDARGYIVFFYSNFPLFEVNPGRVMPAVSKWV